MAALATILDGSGASVREVGGKAAALDRLVASGFPVPRSAALSTEAYRRFVDETALHDYVEAVQEREPDPETMEREADEIDATFVETPTPPFLADELSWVRNEVGGDVSVRSSATVEDAVARSYAGQFRSLLDVTPDELAHAVKLVWASLWHPSVRAYQQAGDGLAADLGMGVVIMRMVAATHAGVVFTVDPSGRADDLRLELVEGVGEGLVSGQVTPQAHVAPRTGHRSFHGKLAPTLDRLCDLCLEIEQQEGEPQDVEWAYDGTELWILQSRPVTVGAQGVEDDDGFDSRPFEDAVYTSAGIGEALPGRLPPLLWTLDGHLLEEAFRRMFDRLGVLPARLTPPEAIVGRFRGRAALNLDLLREVAGRMPGGSAAELERQYFGEVVSSPEELEEADRPGRFAGLRGVVQALRMRRGLEHEARVVVNAVGHLAAIGLDPTNASDAELRACHHGIVALAARAVAAEAAVAAVAAASYQALEAFLRRHVGDEAGSLAQRLTAGRIQAGTGIARELSDLVEEAAGEPVLRELFASSLGPEDLFDRLDGCAEGRAFVRRFREGLRRSGSSAVFAGPTWREQPEAARVAIVQAVRRAIRRRGGDGVTDDPDDVLEGLVERLTSERRWNVVRMMTGQVVDVRIRLLRQLVRDTARFLDRREEVKAAVLRLGGDARRAVDVMGDRLVERGVLDDADDVDLLGHEELLRAYAGRGGPSRDEIRRRRRAAEHAERAGPLPRRFTGRPGRAEVATDGGRVLSGWGAGPGLHEGTPRVVEQVASAQLEPGDVLVARATDPSWTPLFVTAGAVVVEEGGPLSHAAIVARELNIPAVLNVPGATVRLADVTRVTVDGTSGRIVVHDPGDDEVAA